MSHRFETEDVLTFLNRHLTVTADDIIRLLSGCPALENLEFIDIKLTLTRVNLVHVLGEPSINLPHLRDLNLVTLLAEFQRFLLSRLKFPPRSSLRVTGTTNDLDDILHRDILLRLRPCFTTITLGSYSVVLSEKKNDKRCAVTVEALMPVNYNTNDVVAFSVHNSDVSSVRVLEFADSLQHARFDHWALFDRLHSLETVWLRDKNEGRTEMSVERYMERCALARTYLHSSCDVLTSIQGIWLPLCKLSRPP